MTSDMELIGHLAYLLVAISYAARNIVWLRLLAIPACVFGIVFGLYLDENPIWVIVFWNSLFLGINIFQLWVHFKRESSLNDNANSNELLEFLYPMTRSQVSQLVSFGVTRQLEFEEEVLKESQFCDRLFLILNGNAGIYKGEEFIANCGAGSILGDISYLNRSSCSATVKLISGSKVVEWDVQNLRSKLEDYPELNASFTRRLAKDISSKLIRHEVDDTGTRQNHEMVLS